MSREPVDYASPQKTREERLHPVVAWLLFADMAIGVAGVVVLMVAYENVPYDQEPPPLTLALIYGLFLLFIGLLVGILIGLLVQWRRRGRRGVRTKLIQQASPAAYNAGGITSD